MYLKDLKANCRNQAEAIKGWKSLTRSELCEYYLKYAEKDKRLANAYMGALLYSYWNVITYNYMHQGYTKVLSQEDCYNLVVDAILYVLDKKAWMDPKSSLYGDPKGPEKAINKVLDCRKINFFVAATRSKRSINYNNYSLDELEEDSSDGFFIKTDGHFTDPNVKLNEFVVNSFKKKEYLQAFVVDAIMNNDFQNTIQEDGKTYSQFSRQLLDGYLKNMDAKKCKSFSDRYKLNFDEVKSSTKYLKSSNKNSLDMKVRRTLKVLSRDNQFLNTIM